MCIHGVLYKTKIYVDNKKFKINTFRNVYYTLDCMLAKNDLTLDIYQLLPTKIKKICSIDINKQCYWKVIKFQLTNKFMLNSEYYEIIL